jgi:prevent-host-death family protein
MTTVMNVYEAKTQLSRLLDRVERGEEVILARAGRPVARLVPYRSSNPPRRLGLLAGKIRVKTDAVDHDGGVERMLDTDAAESGPAS